MKEFCIETVCLQLFIASYLYPKHSKVHSMQTCWGSPRCGQSKRVPLCVSVTFSGVWKYHVGISNLVLFHSFFLSGTSIEKVNIPVSSLKFQEEKG